ncbi:MAG TPA: hypothetical protein VJ812_13990 [Gemmatimonadaceae bacterium]|jgi:type II secretory pathway pseudopilin PulG|nr:hypothetical protein [Gemmatimonadaceae bacterium]
MSAPTLAFLGLLIAMLAVAAVLVAHSLRKYSARRADSERRAAEAFAEMQRLTRQLREGGEEGKRSTDPNLKPGERLQQRYPGVSPTPSRHHTPIGESA